MGSGVSSLHTDVFGDHGRWGEGPVCHVNAKRARSEAAKRLYAMYVRMIDARLLGACFHAQAQTSELPLSWGLNRHIGVQCKSA